MTNSNNDLFLLDERRDARRKAQAPEVIPTTSSTHSLPSWLRRTIEPWSEYLQYGVVDGSQDCGVDCVYTFVNGTLVSDDFPGSSVPKNPDVDLVLIQAKTAPTFSEVALEKWSMYLPRLMVLDRDDAELSSMCNPALLRETRRFIETYSTLALKRPQLSVKLYYATRGDKPSAGVRSKAALAVEPIQLLFRDAAVSFEALGCRELIDLSRRPTQVSRVLRLAEVPITGDSGDGYICLVRLGDYYELIKDPNTGRLDAALFEANVREHEGETDVNNDIQHTLGSHDDSSDFWWLNNGVTIVSEGIDRAGKRLTLVSPQIVNGLQTSTEIFKYFHHGGNQSDRHLLVRVVGPTNH